MQLIRTPLGEPISSLEKSSNLEHRLTYTLTRYLERVAFNGKPKIDFN
jgi:hypothetical protein